MEGKAPARLAFVGVFASVLLAFLAVGAVLPVLPRYVTGPLGHGDLAVGITVGAFAFTAVIFRPIGGRLSDTRGRRTIVIAGALLAALAGVLYLVPAGLAGLIAARLVLGIGDGWLFTAGATWVVDIAPEARRGQAIGLFGLAIWGGLSVGPAIGELLLQVGSYDAVWIFAAITPLAGAALASRLPDPHVAPDPDAGRPGRILPPEALRPGLALAFANIGFAALISFVVLLLEERDIGHGAVVFTAFSGSVVLTRLAASRLPDRIGARPSAALAGTAEASGLVILALAQTEWLAFAGAIVMGAGFSLLFPSLALMVVDRVEAHRRGAAMGAFTAFFDAGVGIGAPMVGAIVVLGGYSSAFWAGAAFAVAGVAMALLSVASGDARPPRGPRCRSATSPT